MWVLTWPEKHHPPKGPRMANTDDVKGRVKEAAGDLTDNDDLKREGKADRAGGKAKEFIDKVEDKAKDLVDDVKERFDHDKK
jgi:uncharacterized protein YjbJ (UPF0337 family)